MSAFVDDLRKIFNPTSSSSGDGGEQQARSGRRAAGGDVGVEVVPGQVASGSGSYDDYYPSGTTATSNSLLQQSGGPQPSSSYTTTSTTDYGNVDDSEVRTNPRQQQQQYHQYRQELSGRPPPPPPPPAPSSQALQRRQQQHQQHQQQQQQQNERDEEMGYHEMNQAPNTSLSPSSSGAWDSDPQFSRMELERIKNKTRKLRERHSGSNGDSSGDVFHQLDFEDPNEKERGFATGAVPGGASVPTSAVIANGRIHSMGDDTTLTPSVCGGSSTRVRDITTATPATGGGGNRSTRSNSPWAAAVVTPDHQQQQNQSQLSHAAQIAQEALMQSFHKKRPQSQSQSSEEFQLNNLSSRGTEDTNTNNTTSRSAADYSRDDRQELYALHDLCGEPSTQDDIAWRNAIHLLSVQPHSAKAADENGWTPLHVTCLFSTTTTSNVVSTAIGNGNNIISSNTGPPSFLIRALLYVYPSACRLRDSGGRLPIHLVAASSADVGTMKLLINEYPRSLFKCDDHGWTPIQLLLRNMRALVTYERIRTLLGLGHATSDDKQEVAADGESSSPHVHFRRGEHLELDIGQLEAWRTKPPPITHINNRKDRELEYEACFEAYPPDIQAALRRLTQWKRTIRKQEAHEQKEDFSSDCVAMSSSSSSSLDTSQSSSGGGEDDQSVSTPAAIPCPNNGQLPIHSFIKRAIVSPAPLEVDNNDPNNRSFGSYSYSAADEEGIEAGGILKDLEVGSSGSGSDQVGTSSSSSSGKGFYEKNNPPSSVQQPFYDILRLLVSCYPRGLVTRDSQGSTPLLQVLSTDNLLTNPDIDVVELLLGKRTIGYYSENGNDQRNLTSMPPWARDMPLHQLSSSSSSRHLNPAMIPLQESMQLPLHLACEELLSVPQIVDSIYEKYPGANQIQDSYGRTPLHVALSNFRKIPVSCQLMNLLFSEHIAHIKDDHGRTPFDLLLMSSSSTPNCLPPRGDEPAAVVDKGSGLVGESASAAVAEDDVSNVYQRFIQASLLMRDTGNAQDSTTRNLQEDSSRLLRRLRNLPQWLRFQVCSCSQIQEMLLQDMSNPFKCAYTMLQGLAIIALITVFRIQMEDFVTSRSKGVLLSTWYTFSVYSFATLLFILNFLFAHIALSINKFQHLVVCNVWQYIDLLAVLLSIGTSVLLYGDTPDSVLYNLGTVTTGFLWLSLLGYLMKWSYGVSIFVGGFTKIFCYLIWPLIIFGCFIIAFAQMFYTLQQNDCIATSRGWMSSSPISACTVQAAYRYVYVLIRGQEAVVRETQEEQQQDLSFGAILLISFFLVFLVFFILSLLVTVFVSASNLDFNSIALSSFWEPKLASFFSSNDLGFGKSSSSSNGRQPSCCLSFYTKLEDTWDMLTLSFTSGVASSRRKHNNKRWYAAGEASWWRPIWMLAAIVVVPIWFVLGLFTFGLLWPPQIRRWLFRPMGATGWRKKTKVATAEQYAAHQVVQMRNDISQLKIFSYERSGALQNEFREIKDILYSAMKEA